MAGALKRGNEAPVAPAGIPHTFLRMGMVLQHTPAAGLFDSHAEVGEGSEAGCVATGIPFNVNSLTR